jgi:hypothetical protein
MHDALYVGWSPGSDVPISNPYTKGLAEDYAGVCLDNALDTARAGVQRI